MAHLGTVPGPPTARPGASAPGCRRLYSFREKPRGYETAGGVAQRDHVCRPGLTIARFCPDVQRLFKRDSEPAARSATPGSHRAGAVLGASGVSVLSRPRPPRPRRARGQRRRDDPLEGIKSRLRPPVFTDRHVRSATLEHPAPPGTAGRFSPHSGDTRFSGRVKTHCWLLSLHAAREPSLESVSIRRKRRRRRASGLGHETFRQSVRSPLG